jgi:hypothetical protein
LLLKKLIERAQRLKALDDEASRKGKELAEVERSAREYLVREEVERIKATK